MKLFKFYDYWTDFIKDKISDSEDNTSYIDFDTNESILGTPNVKYEQVCFIEDKKTIWTHGQKYTSATEAGVTQEDLDLAIKKHTDKQPKDLLKGIAQSFDYTDNYANIRHYAISKNASGDYTELSSYLSFIERATDQATYVKQYGATYTDDNGVEQTTYKYYPNGHSGLMGVDDVRCMWQSWHAVTNMPDKITGYTSAYADMDNTYITTYFKTEEGDVYNTTDKIIVSYTNDDGTIGRRWDGDFVQRKQFGKWRSENVVLPVASSTQAGVITSKDKMKLDGMEKLGDFRTESESGNSTGEKIIRENFNPNSEVFSDLVSIDFKHGDKILAIADLSACEKTECEMLAIGKDISDWGSAVPYNQGVFHIYHRQHKILVNYVDKNNQAGLKYNGTSGIDVDSDIVTIEIGFDTTLLKPFFTINGTNIIGTSSFMTETNMNEWLSQKTVYIGSVSEATSGKLSNVFFNKIAIEKGELANTDGVKVIYNYGDDEEYFMIANASDTKNGAMSADDKKKLDEIKTYGVATTSEDGLMSASDKTNLDYLINKDGNSSSSSSSTALPIQFKALADNQPSETNTYIWIDSSNYGDGIGGYPMVFTADSSYENRQNNNHLTEIRLMAMTDDNGKNYVDVDFLYNQKTYKMNIDKMIELGILEEPIN